jgi:hypothetical protein
MFLDTRLLRLLHRCYYNQALYLYTEKHMKIQGKQLYVFMQYTCIDINMAELRDSGESMQFLKVIEHANARLGLPGACNRSPGSKLLSITTKLHCGGHLGGRAQLPDTILEEDHPMTIISKCGSN